MVTGGVYVVYVVGGGRGGVVGVADDAACRSVRGSHFHAAFKRMVSTRTWLLVGMEMKSKVAHTHTLSAVGLTAAS